MVGKINASELRLGSVRAQNGILERQHERDKADLRDRDARLAELRARLEEAEDVIEELRGQVIRSLIISGVICVIITS